MRTTTYLLGEANILNESQSHLMLGKPFCCGNIIHFSILKKNESQSPRKTLVYICLQMIDLIYQKISGTYREMTLSCNLDRNN